MDLGGGCGVANNQRNSHERHPCLSFAKQNLTFANNNRGENAPATIFRDSTGKLALFGLPSFAVLCCGLPLLMGAIDLTAGQKFGAAGQAMNGGATWNCT